VNLNYNEKGSAMMDGAMMMVVVVVVIVVVVARNCEVSRRICFFIPFSNSCVITSPSSFRKVLFLIKTSQKQREKKRVVVATRQQPAI
jgi:hypothetical protein